MFRVVRPLLASCLCLAAATCSSPTDEKPLEEHTTLDGDVAVRVAGVPISRSTIERISAAQGATAREAAERATFDALCAAEAEARGLEPDAGRHPSYLRARVLLDDAGARARAAGPPTPEELVAYRKVHFLEIARPAAFVVVHVLVEAPQDAEEATKKAARERASALRVVMLEVARDAQSTKPPDFMPRVSTTRFPSDPLYLRAHELVSKAEPTARLEQLPPTGVDGLTLGPGDRLQLSKAFVAGALPLQNRGDVSPVVESEFGFHVILLLDRLPGNVLSDEQLIEQSGANIVAERGQREIFVLLKSLRASARVELDPALDEALGLVNVREAK